MSKPHILSFDYFDLELILNDLTDKKFKTKQVLDWVYKKKVLDFQLMTNVSLDLRNKLESLFSCNLPEVIDIRQSKDNTKKFLIKLELDDLVEMVYIPGEKKNTLCISTQVGCSRQCHFCATAKLGLKRNLSVEELFMQLMIAYKYFPDKTLTNIVLMGMGEPLDNYDNVLKFIKNIQYESGFSFSGRRITLSTCGVTPNILQLADSGIKVKLAVSLNSAIDKNRDIIMPVNKLYNLDELKKALFYFRKKTSFRITFEYIMIANFNMSDEDVKAINKFCGDISCKINLIKWNQVIGLEWETPTDEQVESFIHKLHHLSAAITLRKSRGQDINGACGQLAGISNATNI